MSDTNSQKVELLLSQLEQGLINIFEGENYKRYLNTMAKFHKYSLNNIILITMQNPEATLVAGYQAWKTKFKRQVKSGEKGLSILAPSPFKIHVKQALTDKETGQPVLDEQGNTICIEFEKEIMSFRAVTVFDVSQTEGEPLPTIYTVQELSGDVEHYQEVLQTLLEISPVPVKLQEITNGAKGYFSPTEQCIAIKDDLPPQHTIKTTLHEIAHAALHNPNTKPETINLSRSQRELEAESVAYVCSCYLGLDTSEYSFPYIAGWSDTDDTSQFRQSISRIKDTSEKIISAMEKKLTLAQTHKQQIELKKESTLKSVPLPGVEEVNGPITKEKRRVRCR